MNHNVIMLLGGKSSRFQGDINKVYCLINNKALYLHALEQFLKFNEITKIILVYNQDDEKLFLESLKGYQDQRLAKTIGGNERHFSILKGLELVDEENVIVHDGARPNINEKIISEILAERKKHLCVSFGINMTDTIKEVTSNGVKTIDRSNLYAIQTPQATQTSLLKECLQLVKSEDKITDDLGAIEKYSDVIPHIIIGSKNNFKITLKEDYILMKCLLEGKNV